MGHRKGCQTPFSSHTEEDHLTINRSYGSQSHIMGSMFNHMHVYELEKAMAGSTVIFLFISINKRSD